MAKAGNKTGKTDNALNAEGENRITLFADSGPLTLLYLRPKDLGIYYSAF